MNRAGRLSTLGINHGLVVRGKFSNRQAAGTLTPKRSPSQYYKGKGCRSLGSISNKGRFKYDESKLPYFEVPDLTNFGLKPYVTKARRFYGNKMEKTDMAKKQEKGKNKSTTKQ